MLGAKATAMGLNVVGTVIMARALGVEGRGAVAVAFSLTLLIVQFGTLGMVTANPYFVARDADARIRIVVELSVACARARRVWIKWVPCSRWSRRA